MVKRSRFLIFRLGNRKSVALYAIFYNPFLYFFNSQRVVAREMRVVPRATRYKPCRPPTPPTACQVTDMDVRPVALILNNQELSAGSPRPPRLT